VRLGQFQDAITSYESVMKDNPDFQTGFNLILCYFALGDADKMKRGFNRLLSIPIQGVAEDEDEEEEEKAAEAAEAVGHARVDALREEMKKLQKEAEHYITTAARLIAPELETDAEGKPSWTGGYEWIIDQLQVDHESLAGQMSIDMGLQYLKKKDFEKAIELLKSFEKKDQNMKAMAATNLSFIYFLEGDYNNADEYADLAVRNSR
jgi:intraflagellar transport protein 88